MIDQETWDEGIAYGDAPLTWTDLDPKREGRPYHGTIADVSEDDRFGSRQVLLMFAEEDLNGSLRLNRGNYFRCKKLLSGQHPNDWVGQAVHLAVRDVQRFDDAKKPVPGETVPSIVIERCTCRPETAVHSRLQPERPVRHVDRVTTSAIERVRAPRPEPPPPEADDPGVADDDIPF